MSHIDIDPRAVRICGEVQALSRQVMELDKEAVTGGTEEFGPLKEPFEHPRLAPLNVELECDHRICVQPHSLS